jgi:hypothetical protein
MQQIISSSILSMHAFSTPKHKSPLFLLDYFMIQEYVVLPKDLGLLRRPRGFLFVPACGQARASPK